MPSYQPPQPAVAPSPPQDAGENAALDPQCVPAPLSSNTLWSRARQELIRLPLKVTALTDPEAVLVIGQAGTLYAQIRLRVTSDHLSDLPRELPAHLLAPACWTVANTWREQQPPHSERSNHAAAFLGGYLYAQRQCVSHRGTFLPAALLQPEQLSNPYRSHLTSENGPEIQALGEAYRAGAAHYQRLILSLTGEQDDFRNQPAYAI